MIRGIGLRGAVAVNVITMVGIGPLITIPLVLAQLHGSIALVAWIVGAIIALCDGLAWAELGSLYPGSGGTYMFLREVFGPQRWGRFLAFLFTWQVVLSAPLLLASGYIGFTQYAAYLWPAVGADPHLAGIVGAAVGVITLVVLYRSIGVVGALGVGLAGVAVATLAAVIAAASTHFSAARAFSYDTHAGVFAALGAGLGPALVITLYDYYGYGQSSTISDEVRDPVRILPRSILISIGLVGVLYVLLQVGVLGVVPWSDLVPKTPGGDVPAAAGFVASTVVERVWGSLPARLLTIAILATAFASTFGNLLGYSRIPYAAANDGLFFRQFASLHERGRFPNVSLVVIGLLALPLCFFSLGDVISALTAGLVVIQNIMQLIAVAALRARGIRAPYRMWLFPLPAIVALAGWGYIFWASGPKAIAFGVLSLAAGVIAFLIRARVGTQWPFALKTAAVIAAIAGASFGFAARPAFAAEAPIWGHAATVERDGNPVFEVDGKPFFVYGAAFFYERLPRDQWAPSMTALQKLGINTLDLYVPWNWHELSDGDFDFTGRTSPRRDLDEVLRLARAMDFKIILRPGPVIRNEWRNGGYPAWLLQRPEYGMPAHDILEGRYPATATLQNAHSDDAAAQWMNNATHMTYAKRWLERVLHECAPDADIILAVALDDDQGAYIDNQTYPAPHFQAYVGWLRDVVHGVTGPREPVFINTYQMKVTASSPVWAMGNWYQSEAYSIGEHDRAQLEFSTGLLHTRPHQPMMASEFQAGWLEQPGDVRPRGADPTNTSLALATMIGMGVRGVINFPAQDTLYPAGWEAPFANSFYAWDAALGIDSSAEARASQTAEFGALVSWLGPQLAASEPRYDAAVAYLGSSYGTAAASNDLFGSIESATIEAQQACRDAGLACALVDLEAISPAALAKYPILVLPKVDDAPPLTTAASRTIAAFERMGFLARDVTKSAQLVSALSETHRRRVVEGIPGATFARDTTGALAGFLTVTNYGNTALMISPNVATIDEGNGKRLVLPGFTVPKHDAIVVPVDLHLRALSPVYAAADVLAFTTCMPVTVEPPHASQAIGFSFIDGDYERNLYSPQDCSLAGTLRGHLFHTNGHQFDSLNPSGLDGGHGDPSPPTPFSTPAGIPIRDDAFLPGARTPQAATGSATVTEGDPLRDGSTTYTFDNSLVRLIVSSDAGARAFVFQDDETRRSVFTSVGAMRDDVAIEPPLSTTDRIAKYTHQFPAGMFNRPYATQILATGSVATARFTYTAPDVVPNGATFERVVSLEPDARAFTVDETTAFATLSGDDPERAVSVTSLAVGNTRSMTTQAVFAPLPTPFAAQTNVHVTASHALGYYDLATHEFATIAWRAGDVEDATILERDASIVVRLTLASGHVAHLRYGYDVAQTPAVASALLAAADAAAQRPNGVEKGTTRAPRTP